MFGHVTAKCIYWVCSLLLALFPIAMVATQYFGELSGLSPANFYDTHYKEILIVIMTFGGLSVFDCFEIFRLLDSRLSLSYLLAVVMAMIIFFLFCVIVAQFSALNLNLDEIFKSVFVGPVKPKSIYHLHWLFLAVSLLLALGAKIWVAVLEVTLERGVPRSPEPDKKLPNLVVPPQDRDALLSDTKSTG